MPWTPGITLDDVQRSTIFEALSHYKGNRTHTAKALKLSVRTLRWRLNRYKFRGFDVPYYRIHCQNPCCQHERANSICSEPCCDANYP